jgi:hypothetical protein
VGAGAPPPGALVALLAGLALGCGGPGPGPLSAPVPSQEPDYLRYVAVEVPIHQFVLLRWPSDAMPLRVHLPPPPPGLFGDPQAVLEAVRGGFSAWTDAAAPGVPRFSFVDQPANAQIRVAWAAKPSGDWSVAFCSYRIDPVARRFGVEQILVTGRWQDGRLADPRDVRRVMLHEVGHALGLAGHSPDPGDAMFADATKRRGEGISARDRGTLRELYQRPIGSPVAGALGEGVVVY